ncbi:MAG: ferredoxin family protein [Candidatus Dadabacteria bacterium]|nr:MAG: ferredoxin family protein [Candidatus Dadabacteria bacterium]
MTYVVTKACLGTKDKSCVEVCPVDCFYDIRKKELNEKYGVNVEGEDGDENVGMLMINPDECINCGACETECPVEAIYEDTSVPDDLKEFIELNEKETVNLSDEEREKLRCVPS